MSEVRHDWLSDRWVIFAPSRSERPDEYESVLRESRSSMEQLAFNQDARRACPFCCGHESETPPSVLQYGCEDANQRDWRVRVVPNKFPAVIPVPTLPPFEIESELRPNSSRADHESDRMRSILFHRQPMLGAHEVIIETPEHLASVTQLSIPHLAMVLQAFQHRLQHWRSHPTLQYAVVFKNCGADAGASLFHTHSQLIATSFVPPEITRLCHRMENFRQEFHQCFQCTVLREEVDQQQRVVEHHSDFVSYCPYASTLPYTLVLAPREHQSQFENLGGADLDAFASMLHRHLRALEALLPQQSYNFVLHTSPFHDHWNRSFHWRLEIFPRLTKLAGFEWGSNCSINPVIPEIAAEKFRRTLQELGLAGNLSHANPISHAVKVR